MQTFMPLPDFRRSAESLDPSRLNKQRVEAKQLLMIHTGEAKSEAWTTHPACIMWDGYADALARYGAVCCEVWLERGGADHANLTQWFCDRITTFQQPPSWTRNPLLNLSHRSNLVRKDEGFYGPQFSDAQPTMPYVWPVRVSTGWQFFLSGASHKRREFDALPPTVRYDAATRRVIRLRGIAA